jgi:hypothetical protein
MKKRFAITALVTLMVALPLRAVLGVGDIVFDPTSYANAVLMMAELVKNYQQLTAQLNLQSLMAQMVPVNMAARYGSPASAGQPASVPYDRFGNLGPWVQQLNQGGMGGTAYSSAAIDLKPYSPNISQWPADEQSKVASQYASVEFADGANITTMQTIGQLRANAQAADQALAALEADSLSSDPAMNTQTALLNKINAAAIAQVRTSRDANQILLAGAEQQLAASKRQRDAEVGEMNAQIERMQQGAAVKAQFVSTVSSTLQSFRWR